jgi:hypothetical protein
MRSLCFSADLLVAAAISRHKRDIMAVAQIGLVWRLIAAATVTTPFCGSAQFKWGIMAADSRRYSR